MDQNLELKLTHILTYGDFFFSLLSDSIKTQMDMWIFNLFRLMYMAVSFGDSRTQKTQ